MASTLTARVGVIGSIWAEVAELAENPLVQRVISVFDKVDHRVDGKSWWGGWLPLMRLICFGVLFGNWLYGECSGKVEKYDCRQTRLNKQACFLMELLIPPGQAITCIFNFVEAKELLKSPNEVFPSTCVSFTDEDGNGTVSFIEFLLGLAKLAGSTSEAATGRCG